MKIDSLLPKGVYGLTILKRIYKTKAEAKQARRGFEKTWITIRYRVSKRAKT